MPQTLDSYLLDELPKYKQSLDGIEKLTDSIVEVFRRFAQDAAWPKQLVNGELPPGPGPDTNFSYSTTAMIVFALRLAEGTIATSALVPAIGKLGPLSSKNRQQLDELLEKALKRAAEL